MGLYIWCGWFIGNELVLGLNPPDNQCLIYFHGIIINIVVVIIIIIIIISIIIIIIIICRLCGCLGDQGSTRRKWGSFLHPTADGFGVESRGGQHSFGCSSLRRRQLPECQRQQTFWYQLQFQLVSNLDLGIPVIVYNNFLWAEQTQEV